jgi:hypothetical protein
LADQRNALRDREETVICRSTHREEVIMDWTLEIVVIPVSDIDRSIAFYRDQVGFTLDMTRSLRRCT